MTDNRTTELLPCPFCGGEAFINGDPTGNGGKPHMHGNVGLGRLWSVECDECGADGGFWQEREIAIAAWNTRAELGSGMLTADDVLNAVYKHGARWQAIADELNAELGSDDEYEAKMDALLCRLTNGKWSKSRSYDLDFMVSCIEEEYETLHAKELAELGSGTNPDGLPNGLTISEDGTLLNWRGENYVMQNTLWGGTLTAEQVRETVEKHWHDLSDEYDMPEATALPEYSYNWQAITDELNAELGSGTCELTETDSYNNANEVIHVLECSECGETCEHVNGSYPRCPHCGRKVVSA